MKKRILSALLATAMTVSMGATLAFAADETKTETVTTTTTDTKPVVTPSQTAPVHSMPTDVAQDAWYAPAVSYVLEGNMMSAANDKFMPDTAITREAVADALYRTAKVVNMDLSSATGMALKEMTDYNTISTDKMDGVAFCFYAGIMTGNGDDTMTPTANITREEMAAMLQRFTSVVSMYKNAEVGGMAIREFTDYASISDWAQSAITFCMSTNMLKGNADGSFNPKGNVTNAEMAQMLFNMDIELQAKIKANADKAEAIVIYKAETTDDATKTDDTVKTDDTAKTDTTK